MNRISGAMIGGVLTLAAALPAAQAATVNVSGTNVTYTYDSDQFAGFGATVSVVGDALRILLRSFDVSDTSSSPGPSLANGTFVFTATMHNSAASFGNIAMSEEGDYLLQDFTPNNVQGASVSGQFRAFDNQSVSSEIRNFNAGSLTVLNTPFVDFDTRPWSASALTTSVAGWASSSVTLQLQNLLTAFAGGDDLSFIEKKSIVISPTVSISTPVPVPPALWLMGTALLALAGIRRRA